MRVVAACVCVDEGSRGSGVGALELRHKKLPSHMIPLECKTCTHRWKEVDVIVASDIIYDNTMAYLHLSRHLAHILSRPASHSSEGAAERKRDRGGERRPTALMMLQVSLFHVTGLSLSLSLTVSLGWSRWVVMCIVSRGL